MSSARLVVLLVVAAFGANLGVVHAATLKAGDLAPLGSPDGVLNAADVEVLQRIILGQLIPSPTQLLVGDVAPLGHPDGKIDAGDLIVLLRAVHGEIALADVQLGPNAPTLNALPTSTTDNPLVVAGTATPGIAVHLYVNGVQEGEFNAGTDGNFSIPAVLSDGSNDIYVTAFDGTHESSPSGSQNVNYQNTVPRDQVNTTITQNTVWTPGATPSPYTITGTLTVNPGVKLTIAAGTELKFNSRAQLAIHGSLDVQGVDGNHSVFTSNQGTPAGGDWSGIYIGPDATTVKIQYSDIDYAATGIEIASASDVAISHSKIDESDYVAGIGIWVHDGSTATIDANEITHTGSRGFSQGLEIYYASPMVVGNTITGFDEGVFEQAGSPQIVGGNSISGNGTGITLWGDQSSASNNPNPIIRGNKIFSNGPVGGGSQNIDVDEWVDPNDNSIANIDVELDVSGNWWGTTDPSEISAGLRDYDSFTPVLKVVPFDDASGNPVNGAFLNGLQTGNRTLGRDTAYTVVGSYVVARNSSLTVSAGVNLGFVKASELAANGTLNVIGETGNPVQMDSTQAVKGGLDWWGIILSGDSATISHAMVSHARWGVRGEAGQGSVIRDSVFDACDTGLLIRSGVQVNVAGNQITGSAGQGIGIDVQSGDATIADNVIQQTSTAIGISISSPTLTGNDLSNNTTGISISRGYNDTGVNPVIDGDNRIINNVSGIQISGNNAPGEPAPQIHDNEIYGNTNFNLSVANYETSAIVDASKNWWGTSVEDDIVAGISGRFHVLYSPFKDESGGLITSTRLSGVLGQSLTLDGNQTYQFDTLVIPQGVTLTIGAGATLEFLDNQQLVVGGDLVLEGTQSSPITFTRTAGSTGYWQGLYVNSPSLKVHDIVVEHAITGLHAASGPVEVSDSRFTDCATFCLFAEGAQNSLSSVTPIHVTVHRVSVDSSPSATGFKLRHAYGDVSGNTIRGADTGVWFSGYVPSFTVSKNLIADSGIRGIWVQDDWTPENPQATYNNLENLGTRNYEAGSGAPVGTTLTGTNNWWGTDADADIQASIVDGADTSNTGVPTVSYSPYLSGPVPTPPSLDELPPQYSPASLTITGHGDPSEAVRVYVNGVDSGTGTADNTGAYSIPITLAEGDSEVHVVGYNATVESYPSRSYHVIRDVTAPVVTVTSPASGALTNQSAITITGKVSEPATLVIGGQTVPLTQDNSFSYGPYFLAEGVNNIAITATDLAGNASAPTTLTLTLDSTPPAPPNMGAITIGNPVGGMVTVAGVSGSVDASTKVTVINARTGESATQTAGTDGSFTIQLKAGAGDAIYVASSDAIGNQSLWGGGTVAGSVPALAVNISSPADGASVAQDTINVQGTYQGPGNTSVMVNGVSAVVHDGQFYCDNVPLNSGAQDVQVTATAIDGSSTSASITVTSTAASDFVASLDKHIAIVGEPVELYIEQVHGAGIQNVDVDFNGDAIVDASAASADSALSYTYTQAGLYTVTATITDADAVQHVLTQTVLVQTAAGVLGTVRHVYDGMLAQLSGQRIPQAEQYLTVPAVAKFDSYFVANQASLSDIVGNVGDVVASSISGDVASIYVRRDKNGEKYIYHIYLMRGQDGIWRIADM